MKNIVVIFICLISFSFVKAHSSEEKVDWLIDRLFLVENDMNSQVQLLNTLLKNEVLALENQIEDQEKEIGLLKTKLIDYSEKQIVVNWVLLISLFIVACFVGFIIYKLD